jgi:hypothetical protein
MNQNNASGKPGSDRPFTPVERFFAGVLLIGVYAIYLWFRSSNAGQDFLDPYTR